ncbi:MAG: hypothetical protein LBP93_05920 [Treponema sp.]|jgi:hypothetical protein|nr:hypothetical protein [Treponema sp.]
MGLILMGCAGVKPQTVPEPPQTEDAPDAALSFDRQNYTFPGDLRFVPAPFSIPEAAPGVGLVTTEPGDRGAGLNDAEKALLGDSFRAAYLEGLLREDPLMGVLGGDRVHGWPAADPLGWVQNWRSGVNFANSWGIPSLILAVQGITRNRAFVVQGPILDLYGRSAGIDGANGIPGYGYPCGNEFFYEGGRAQRFSLGLITVDGEGQGSFTPQTAPSVPASPPPQLGVFPGGSWALQEDFQSAWNIRMDQNGIAMSPDGPVRRISFSQEPWIINTDTGPVEIRGVYFQTFEGETEALILPESPDLSFRARLLRGPFLDAFLLASSRLLPGAESAKGGRGGAGIPQIGAEDRFSQALIQGLSVYGLPLTDPGPRMDEDVLVEAQRFSAGWMIGRR